MTIVVDASLVTVLASGDPRRAIVDTLMRGWLRSGEDLHAPALLPFEVASAVTRLVSAGALPGDRLADVWQTLMSLPISYHPMLSDGELVIATALRLGRQSAYDAAYLVLARTLSAEVWTLDGRLARNASGLGYPVHLAG